MEYLDEKFPEKQMYPKDAKERAIARSLVMEMHAGFSNMRELLNFHAKKKFQNFNHGPAQADIDRVKSLWTSQLEKSGGPFLFGKFGLVDAMYAPVVGRFETYGVPVSGLVKKYCEAMMELPAMKSWYEGAHAEDFIAPHHE